MLSLSLSLNKNQVMQAHQISSFFSLSGKNLPINIAYLCLVGVIGVGLATLAFRQQKKTIISSWKKEKAEILGWALVCLLILATTSLFLKHLAALVSRPPAGKPLNQQELETSIKPSFQSWAKVGFMTVIWAPLFEELIFRWLLFETFGNNYFSVLLSSLTFGFAHYQGETSVAGILIFLIYPIMGFAFASTYYKQKKNLIWPVAFHFLNNLVAFTFMLFNFLK